MSTAYIEIAACADRIAKVVGSSTRGQPLALSGRSPHLPVVTLNELLAKSTFDRLEPIKRLRITEALSEPLKELRHRLTRQFWQIAEQHYSLSECGLPDPIIEAQLVESFEATYSRFLNQLRTRLQQLLERLSTSKDWDNRNTRGGFGDVSPPISLKANISANPPNPRNSIQLHKVSPLNRNRPLVKIDFIGTSSSTSPHPYS
jgi:hypothetical protein